MARLDDLLGQTIFLHDKGKCFFCIDSIENPQVLLPGELQLRSGRSSIALPQTQEGS